MCTLELESVTNLRLFLLKTYVFLVVWLSHEYMIINNKIEVEQFLPDLIFNDNYQKLIFLLISLEVTVVKEII